MCFDGVPSKQPLDLDLSNKMDLEFWVSLEGNTGHITELHMTGLDFGVILKGTHPV